MKRLKKEIKKLPQTCGVYLFKKKRKVLYVGKSVNLASRVKSYFSSFSERVQRLLKETTKIDFIKTDSLLEALVVEANLIKRYWPKYNVYQKDNRSFVYLLISKNDPFPRPIILRGRELEKYPFKNFYIFGPYQSWSLLKKALFLIRKIFPFCEKPNSKKPCFYYQIGLCLGACIGKVSQKEYRKMIKNLVLFLSGEKRRLLKNLKKEHPQKIEILKNISDSILIKKEEITEEFPLSKLKIEGYDISHFSGRGTYGSLVVFEDGLPKKEDYRIFKIKKAKEKDDLSALYEVISRRFNHKEWSFPNLILVDGGISQVRAVLKALKEKNLKISVVGIAKGKKKKERLILKEIKKKGIKEMILSSFPLLKRVRDEAHRFSQKFSRKFLRKTSLEKKKSF